MARNPFLAVVGASYGAYVAANLLFKRPAQVSVACGLGGVYAHGHRLDGFYDDSVYQHTPPDYLPQLDDPARLAAIRSTRGIDLFAAADDPWVRSSVDLAEKLKAKSLPFSSDIWPAPANHHEFWWKKQLRCFLDRHYG